jgi:glycosyltransferase involved in cell wall biosynthesis
LKISWLTCLDPFTFSGGGELHNRTLIEIGRERGHEIEVSAWWRGRWQRMLRRSGLHRALRPDWDAEMFVLANIRNTEGRGRPFPERVVERALASGRAVVLADAWVDVCTLDLPCGGDRATCPAACSKSWANKLYGGAAAAVFVSPMQRRLIEAVIDVPLPEVVVYSRPQIDTSLFRPLGLERDIDVLYVGTISTAKGYDNLLSRFGAERLTFVGRNRLERPIQGSWLGELPYESLPVVFNRARTFAHLPAWIEPMGRAVVEAGLCGCELALNERVGVTSYPDADWRDPERVRHNGARFWDDLEAGMSPLRAADRRS